MIEVSKESIFCDHFRLSFKIYVVIQLDITSKTFVAEIIKLDIKVQGAKQAFCFLLIFAVAKLCSHDVTLNAVAY